MRLIFFMTLAGTLALDSLNANERLTFGNQNIARFEPATFVIDGKFTVQLLVSITPAEEEIVRRRLVFANRRRPNGKEMSTNFKEEITLQLADQDATLRPKVAHKNRTANEGHTARRKNRFNRLPTSTTRHPISTNRRAALQWDSRKTKDVKGSVRPALNKTAPTSSRPRINRIRTTTLRSPVSRKTHFAVGQAFDNGPNQTGAVLNPNPTAMANNTVAQFQEHQKAVDTINLQTAANPKGKAIGSQSDGDPHSHLRGSSKEEPDVGVSIVGNDSTPVSQHPVVAKDYTAKQQPTTQTVEIKLPLPLNWRKPIAKDPDVADVAPKSDGQVFLVNETLTAQDAQNSTLTSERAAKHLRSDKLLDEGYDNKHEISITSNKAIYDENKGGDSLSKNEETGTNPTMENDNAPSLNGSFLVFPFNEGQLEDIAIFDEPIFRHSVADRDFSSETTTPASAFTTSDMEVIHVQSNNLTLNMPASLEPNPAVMPELFDEITTEPVMDILPVTEILPTATHDQFSNKDPSDFPWKKIGDIEFQINPITREVINIKSQTISGVHFIMATSHLRISLHSEESREFPWNRIGDFEVQMDPQTKQVVNIRTGNIKRTRTSDTLFEQHAIDSGEQHQPASSIDPDDSRMQSTTEVLMNETETVATVSLQTTLRLPPQDPTELENGYHTQMNKEVDKEVNVRMQITTSLPAQSSVNEEQEDSSTEMFSLPTAANRSRPSVKHSEKLEEISIEMNDDPASRKKQTVRVDDRVRATRVRRPSSSNSEEHGVFLLRYADEEDEVQPARKVVIVNENRNGRGFDGQRGDLPTRKESPYFYYHYDTSRALVSSSCNLPLLVCSVLLIFVSRRGRIV